MPRKKKLPRIPICPTCLYLKTHCTCGPADRIKLDSPEAFAKAISSRKPIILSEEDSKDFKKVMNTLELNIPARQVGKTAERNKDIKEKLEVTFFGPEHMLILERIEDRKIQHLEKNFKAAAKAISDKESELAFDDILKAFKDITKDCYRSDYDIPLSPKMVAMLRSLPEFQQFQQISVDEAMAESNKENKEALQKLADDDND